MAPVSSGKHPGRKASTTRQIQDPTTETYSCHFSPANYCRHTSRRCILLTYEREKFGVAGIFGRNIHRCGQHSKIRKYGTRDALLKLSELLFAVEGRGSLIDSTRKPLTLSRST